MAYEVWTNDNEVVFLTDDFNLILKAQAIGLPCCLYEYNSSDDFYTGYKILQGGTYFINELFDNIEHGMNDYNFVCNEYLILFNSDTGKVSEHRYNGHKFVDLKLPESKVIKGRNSLQRCALDLLNNKDISIVAVNGMVGSGKTYMAVRMALHHMQDKNYQKKILAVREALGEGKEVGFLKGDFEEKTKLFFKPIEQSLAGKAFELESLVQRGDLESTIPFYIKGTTYSDTTIIVDESEDFTRKQLKLVGTRLGEHSRIFFAGDYKQSSLDSSENNALVQMCNELKGNDKFGCIYLDEDVRSDASKIFADLFTN
jgi:predicted ribonuclease YlaK